MRSYYIQSVFYYLRWTASVQPLLSPHWGSGWYLHCAGGLAICLSNIKGQISWFMVLSLPIKQGARGGHEEVVSCKNNW